MKKCMACIVLLFVGLGAGAQSSFYDLVATGTPEQVLAAIKEGADAGRGDRLGVTPLMAAAEKNSDPAVLLMLLAAGARITDRDSLGDTPLMYAAKSNPSPAAMKALLQEGARMRASETMREKPLSIWPGEMARCGDPRRTRP